MRWSRWISTPTVLILFTVLSVLAQFQSKKYQQGKIIVWDIAGYYLYLPGTFIYQDLKEFEFYQKQDPFINHDSLYGINDIKEGETKCLKYACGVAILEMPAFLTTYGLVSLIEKETNVFSPPFQLSVFFSALAFTLLGLWILSKFLAGYYKPKVVAITLLIIGLGTNLFYYATYEPGLGHNYLFFLFAVILRNTQLWLQKGTLKNFAYISLALALAILVRPTAIVVGLVPLVWVIFDNRLKAFLTLKHVLIGLGIAMVVFSPQLLYWKYATGKWVYYSYNDEGFDFTNWQIIKGLFSYRKGWFVYTPLAFVAVVGLVYSSFLKKCKSINVAIWAYLIPCLYFTFCWHMWYYGGGFGARVMIQSLALLAFPLAGLIQLIMRQVKRLRWTVFILFFALVGLNLFQSYQYHKTIIHWDSMTKAYYWKVFLKPHHVPGAETLLMSKDDPEF